MLMDNESEIELTYSVSNVCVYSVFILTKVIDNYY